MNKLEQARTQIDAIDREMAKLYEARLDAVKDVIAYKIENDLPILDSVREQVVIEKNLQFIQNPDYKEYYESFIKFIMKESKAYQRTLQSHDKVGYCGVTMVSRSSSKQKKVESGTNPSSAVDISKLFR